ncbi:MAG: SBBP repeat-containing protein [Bacteroidia bacterium]|nr:SBBP repeat-containing protein [Bacteroidia bacterium]
MRATKRFLFRGFYSLLILLLPGVKGVAQDISFEENRGQWAPPVQFMADLPGGRIFLENTGWTYVFWNEAELEVLHERFTDRRPLDTAFWPLPAHAVRVKFPAGQTLDWSGADLKAQNRNYFLGNDPKHWQSQVPTFARVLGQGMGMAVHLYSQGDNLKYDLVFERAADAQHFALELEGLEDLQLNGDELVLQTSVNRWREAAPRSQQGDRQVRSAYKLEGNTLSFSFPDPLSPEQPILIDPEVVFSTWSGATQPNYGACATNGPDGSLYAGAIALNAGYQATPGAFQLNFLGGIQDMVISKYSPDGSNLIYTTYLGGASFKEAPISLLATPQDELVILGGSESNDFPVTPGVYDPTWNGLSDFTLSKLNSTGTSLLASTFVGGLGNDGFVGIDIFNTGDRADLAFDPDGNVYVAGSTTSPDFPTSATAYQQFFSPQINGIIFKLNPNFTSLLWSTYLGDSGNDLIYGLALDAARNVYVSGGTASQNFPTTPGSYQPTHQGNWDGFVSQISNDGSTLLNSTLIGTSTYDQAIMIALDLSGNVYTTGQTMSNQFPLTPNSFSNVAGKNFFMKFDPGLSNLESASLIGAGKDYPDVTPTAFMVDSCGRIFFAGWAVRMRYWLKYLPITPDAIQSETDTRNLYLLAFSKDFEDQYFGSFFGGKKSMEHSHTKTDRFDKHGVLYHSICTGCRLTTLAGIPPMPGVGNNVILHSDFYNDFPTTNALYPNNQSGNCSMAAFKIDYQLWEVIADFDILPKPESCARQDLTFASNCFGGFEFYWDFGDGETAEGDTVAHAFAQPGTYQVRLVAYDSTKCIDLDTAFHTVTILPAPQVDAGQDTFVCEGHPILLQGSGNGIDPKWSPKEGLDRVKTLNPRANPQVATTYYLTMTSANGCEGRDSVFVGFVPIQGGFSPDPLEGEIGVPVVMVDQSTGASAWYWDFGDGSTGTGQNPGHSYAANGEFLVMQIAETQEGCRDTTFEKVLIESIARIFLPTAFTPNGDGLNDVFTPISKYVAQLNLEIFDRFGMLIFQSSEQFPGWDGKFKQESAPEGVYSFKIIGKDLEGNPLQRVGTVTLLR